MFFESLFAAAATVFAPHAILLMAAGTMAGLVAAAIPGFTISRAVCSPAR